MLSKTCVLSLAVMPSPQFQGRQEPNLFLFYMEGPLGPPTARFMALTLFVKHRLQQTAVG